MKKLVCLFTALALMVTCFGAFAISGEEAAQIAASVTQTETDQSLIQSPFISVIASVKGSVVGVNHYENYSYTNYSGGFGGYGGWGGYGSGSGRNRETVERLVGTGSGVVVYDGFVLTNYHVVEDATRLTINIAGTEEEIDCTLVSYDENKDIAVVYCPELDLPAVPLGDSDMLQEGEWVVCIGNPLTEELNGTVTVGIISALNRSISSTTITDKYGLKVTVTNTMIQTDAAINEGNSGGGLFNTLGQLMGIPSMKYSGSSYSRTTIEGIGLAIPINTAKPIISEAIVKVLTDEENAAADKPDAQPAAENGDKPMMGVSGTLISASNYYLVYTGLLPGGMLIDTVTENSPAALAGIQPYDIIVEIDGQIASSITVIRSVLDAHAYGDSIPVKVYRSEGLATAETANDLGEGEYIDLTLTLFEFNVEA